MGHKIRINQGFGWHYAMLYCTVLCLQQQLLLVPTRAEEDTPFNGQSALFYDRYLESITLTRKEDDPT